MLHQRLQNLRVRESGGTPTTHVYYLHTDDNVGSVLDRLEWTDAQRVVLVVPSDTSVLADRLELVRVLRFAAQKHVQVALVTVDPAQRAIAREVGFAVQTSVDRATTAHWRRRPLASFLTQPSPQQKDRPHPKELRPGDSQLSGYILVGMTVGVSLVSLYVLLTTGRLDAQKLGSDAVFGVVGGATSGLAVFLLVWLAQRYAPRLLRSLRWAVMTLVFAVGIVAPVAAGYIIIPGARVTLTPSRDYVGAIARVTVVVPPPGQQSGLAEIDFEGQRIAGRRVSAEVAGEAIAGATGTSEVPSSRAAGTVVFTNLLAQDYTVGRNTAVRTSAGVPVRFLTSGDVTVPPLGQAAIGIEAVEPGPAGNVGIGLVNQIEGAAARAVRVTNPEPTRGGGVSQVRAVTEADREALRRTVLVGLQGQGYQRVLERPEVEGGLREGEYLIPGSVRVFQILHETYDRFATEEAESVKLEVRVLVTGVVIDLGDAYNLARHVLERQVQAGYELIDARFRPGLMGDNVLGDGTLTFFVEAEGTAEARLQYDELKQLLRGKPYEEGVVLLGDAWRTNELPVKEMPGVQIRPDWAAERFPLLVWRIQVLETEDD